MWKGCAVQRLTAHLDTVILWDVFDENFLHSIILSTFSLLLHFHNSSIASFINCAHKSIYLIVVSSELRWGWIIVTLFIYACKVGLIFITTVVVGIDLKLLWLNQPISRISASTHQQDQSIIRIISRISPWTPQTFFNHSTILNSPNFFLKSSSWQNISQLSYNNDNMFEHVGELYFISFVS